MPTSMLQAAPEFSAGVVDSRPELSVYESPRVKLYLQDGSILFVPTILLLKSPKLSPRKGHLDLEDVSRDAGHVLAHYLFTDTYQCLRPKGSSPHERLVAEFTTSIRVYATARAYELPYLEELAKDEIRRLGDGFRTPLVVDLVQNAYPNTNTDDVWLSSYLKTRLKLHLEKPAEPLDWDSTTERKTISISDILFRNMLELFRENIILPRERPNGAIEQAPKDPSPSLAISVPEVRREPYEPEWSGKDGMLAFSLKEGKTADAEPEPEAKVKEDIWAVFAPKKKKKRNKGKVADPVPPYGFEPILEPAPETAAELTAEPEPYEPEATAEPEPYEPEATAEPEPYEPEPPVDLEPQEKAEWEVVEAWPSKDGPEYALEAEIPTDHSMVARVLVKNQRKSCRYRVEHIFGSGWKECPSCRDFVRQMSESLGHEGS